MNETTIRDPRQRTDGDILNRTDWDLLKQFFEEALFGDYFFGDPRQVLQNSILRLIDLSWVQRHWPDEYPSLRRHQWTPFEKDCVRWAKLCEVLGRGEGWTEALETTSEELRGRAARGAPGTMQLGYQHIQKTLPPRLRRPHRPRGPNRH
jgi:hypothetical protein